MSSWLNYEQWPARFHPSPIVLNTRGLIDNRNDKNRYLLYCCRALMHHIEMKLMDNLTLAPCWEDQNKLDNPQTSKRSRCGSILRKKKLTTSPAVSSCAAHRTHTKLIKHFE